MHALVLGATGLAGQAFVEELSKRRATITRAARNDADETIDLTDAAATTALLDRIRPTLVVNAAARTDFRQCEEDPSSWLLNCGLAGVLSEWTTQQECRLIQISTDHFYAGDGDRAHREDDPVVLLNAYARQKFAAEALALRDPDALILRTAIVGWRGWPAPTFAEWAESVVAGDLPATLFGDAYTSLVDVRSFAAAALDLLDLGATGVLNLASREVFSKKQFVEALAAGMGAKLTNAREGTVGDLGVRRADSLGLDVSECERLLGRRLPSLQQVVTNLLEQRRTRA